MIKDLDFGKILTMSIFHVIPINDDKEHTESSVCKCHPVAETLESGDILIVHNSFDGREYVEKLIETCKN
jgi:hypothetical protein